MSLNHICVLGRFARDPELRQSQSGTSVTNFTLAVDRDFKDKNTGDRGVDWIPCVAWGSQAEFVSKFFSKGRMAIIDGRLQIRDWTDKDGNKRTTAEVVAQSVYFADSKRPENSAPAPAPATYTPPTDTSDGFSELEDESGELPFLA